MVVMLDVIKDRLPKLFHAAKTVTSDSLLSDFGEEALHLVEPTAVGGNEVQMPARMFSDPQPHLRCFVCSVVVQDRMDIQLLWRGLLQLLKEKQKLLLSVSLLAASINFS